MVNFCALSGEVLTEPEVYFVGEDNKTPVTSFKMELWVDGTRFGWIDVVCSEGVAAVAAKYVHLGKKLLVMGFLTRAYEKTAEGYRGYNLRLHGVDFEFVESGTHPIWGPRQKFPYLPGSEEEGSDG